MFELVECRSDLWRVYLRDDSGIPPDGLEGQLCLLEEWFTIDWDSGPFLDGDLRVYHTATPVQGASAPGRHRPVEARWFSTPA